MDDEFNFLDIVMIVDVYFVVMWIIIMFWGSGMSLVFIGKWNKSLGLFIYYDVYLLYVID